ncbi:MAG: HyaD/HybD family hydrogenase maturation endopeptidase [Chloroflexota bacterium]
MTEPTKIQTLVLGVGNTLMSDEGIGVRVVERLVRNYEIPEEVQVLDGGTLGMDLLYYLEGVPNLLIVDAIQANREPGCLLRLVNDEVPAFLSMKMSPHQIGVPDMLATAKLRGTLPPNIVLWGVQPDTIEIGLELSPTLAALADALVEKVIVELKQWGHTINRRVPAT